LNSVPDLVNCSYLYQSMKILSLIIPVIALIVPDSAECQNISQSQLDSIYTVLMPAINPKHVNWVKGQANEVIKNNLGEKEIRTNASRYAIDQKVNGEDIDWLIALVLMQSARNNDADLKNILSEVQELNEQRKKLNDYLSELRSQQKPTRTRFSAIQKSLQQLLSKYLNWENSSNKGGPYPDGQANKTPDAIEINNTINRINADLNSMDTKLRSRQSSSKIAEQKKNLLISALTSIIQAIHESAKQAAQNLR